MKTTLKKLATGLNRLIHGAERHRAYIYRVVTGLAGLAVAGGLIDGTRQGYIVAILGLIFGAPNGLAAANSSTKPKA